MRADTRLAIILIASLVLMSAVALSSVLRFGQARTAAPTPAGALDANARDIHGPAVRRLAGNSVFAATAPPRLAHAGTTSRFMGAPTPRGASRKDGAAAGAVREAWHGAGLAVLIAGLLAGSLLARGLLAQLAAEPARAAATAPQEHDGHMDNMAVQAPLLRRARAQAWLQAARRAARRLLVLPAHGASAGERGPAAM